MSNIINLFDNWLNKSRSTAGVADAAPHLEKAGSTLDEVNYLQQVVFKTSSTGKWLFLTDKWFDCTGYAPEECLGKSWLNHIHPQDHDICQGYLRRASKGQIDTLATSIRVITRQNELRWMEMRASILPGKQAHGFCLIGTLTDISAEKAENERLQANYRALHSLISNIPGMAYRCRNNRDWTMEFVSSGCQELTGYNAEQVINNKTAWSDIIHPEAREYVWMTIQTAVQNQQPFELTYRIITREGDEKWVWERGQGNFADNGELLGLEGLITDITDNKRQSLRIERDTLFDPVTKLTTQHLFFNRIQHAIELAEDQPEHNFSVVMLYISQHSNAPAKQDSDTSDQLAKELGLRLKGILKISTSVCRLRDNEFGILLEHCANEYNNSVSRTLRSLQACLKAPLKIGQQVVYVKASVGVAVYEGHANNSEILQDASRAMARARELGGGKIEFANSQLNNHMTTVLGTENELRNALEEGELELGCLPLKPCTQHSSTTPDQAWEIKLVWHHGRRGTLYADSFYPHIEDPELICLLGKFILNALSRRLKECIQPDKASQIFIHGLSEQILNGEISQHLDNKLGLQEYPNTRIHVEIDARHLDRADQNALKNIKQLSSQGIGVTITDITPGAPYADRQSLPNLHAIKIQLTDFAQSRATIAYYNALGISVIAEGTDSPQANQVLEDMAIDYLLDYPPS